MPSYETLIQSEAMLNGLDPNLVRAIVMTESSGNPWAVRHEPAWRYLVFPRDWASRLGITAETETTLQSCSFGLMQVMGSVARELGFQENLLRLTDPATGLHYGCLKLKSLLVRYGLEADAISAYNQGSPRKTDGGMYLNETYVDRVSTYLRQYRALV